MKKIMFSDKYGLTEAVLKGRKTMTRRLVPEKLVKAIEGGVPGYAVMESKYKVGEVVAVAQSYKDAGFPPSYIIDEFHPNIEYEAGFNNKMFVKADLMPHQIRITNIRVERLQDITEEDCRREGVGGYTCNLYEFQGECYSYEGDKNKMGSYKTAREAFASLFDKISGKGTWDKNPWVFVYEFKLIR